MRVVFLIAIMLSCSSVLRAQQQERKLLDRLLNPDGTLAYQPQSKTFQNDKSFTGAGKAYVKDFYFTQKVEMKTFSSKEFSGAKNFWAGDFKFSNSALPKERFVISNASKTYGTTSVDVKNARESGEAVPVSKYADNGPFKGREDDQTNLATDPKAKAKRWVREQRAANTPMTVDQVRDLLNKNN